ncbi:hypothetical protein [Cryptosporangium japonicum]|uniref:Tetratricopeptide repeat protein n=1 Tax=Cryptosporangium japonicum TaxID=80872 RepID=A0ABN0V627_9ACTN
MSTVRLTDPVRLRAYADPLWTAFEAGTVLRGEQLHALAEASFRLGVHPDTDPADSLTWLRRAHTADPDNPRYPYHLGLQYLRTQRPDRADVWLAHAAELAPDSHRIAAHRTIVERTLDAEEAGRPGYSGSRRRRAAEISDTIRDEGCRWPGLPSLEFEARVAGPTTVRARDLLERDLVAVADDAGRRPGGTTEFAVLAVQWLTVGYPVATIRRVRGRIPHSDVATAVVERVCELAETPVEKAGELLARHQAAGTIPEVVLALLHRQLLLTRPLRFAGVGAYRAAARFTEEDASGVLAALIAAIEPLRAKERLATEDVAPARETLTVDELTRIADDLAALQADVKKHAKAIAAESGAVPDGSTPDVAARLAGDESVLNDTIAAVDRLSEEFLAQLDGVRPTPDASGGWSHLEACRVRLRDVRSARGSLRRIVRATLGSRVTRLRADQPDLTVRPSDEALALAERLRPYGRTPVPADGVPTDLASALRAADTIVDDNVATAISSLERYPAGSLVTRLLRGYVLGVAAETYYRMGRTDEARTRWNRLRVAEPLNLPVLQNLAVAHTCAGDLVPARGAWTALLEALYVTDLAAGDPRRRAARRAEVHRTLADALSTPSLVAAGTSVPDDLSDLPPLLASTVRLGTMLAHRRLQLINHSLSCRHPALRLGLARSATDDARQAVLDRADADIRTAAVALPPRLQPPLLDGYPRWTAAAVRAAALVTDRPRDPRPAREEDERVHLLVEVLVLKRRIRDAIREDRAWALATDSGTVLGNLRGVDELVLDPNDELVRRAALELAPETPPEDFLEQFADLATVGAHVALHEVLDRYREPDYAENYDRYRRIGRSWSRNRVDEEHLRVLDAPASLYAAPLLRVAAITKRGRQLGARHRAELETAITAMRYWCERLPGATGPARARAGLHAQLQQYRSAEELLRYAREQAFADCGRYEVDLDLVELLIERRRQEQAIEAALGMLHEHPDDVRVLYVKFRAEFSLFIRRYNDHRFSVEVGRATREAARQAEETGRRYLELTADEKYRARRAHVREQLNRIPEILSKGRT